MATSSDESDSSPLLANGPLPLSKMSELDPNVTILMASEVVTEFCKKFPGDLIKKLEQLDRNRAKKGLIEELFKKDGVAFMEQIIVSKQLPPLKLGIESELKNAVDSLVKNKEDHSAVKLLSECIGVLEFINVVSKSMATVFRFAGENNPAGTFDIGSMNTEEFGKNVAKLGPDFLEKISVATISTSLDDPNLNFVLDQLTKTNLLNVLRVDADMAEKLMRIKRFFEKESSSFVQQLRLSGLLRDVEKAVLNQLEDIAGRFVNGTGKERDAIKICGLIGKVGFDKVITIELTIHFKLPNYMQLTETEGSQIVLAPLDNVDPVADPGTNGEVGEKMKEGIAADEGSGAAAESGGTENGEIPMETDADESKDDLGSPQEKDNSIKAKMEILNRKAVKTPKIAGTRQPTKRRRPSVGHSNESSPTKSKKSHPNKKKQRVAKKSDGSVDNGSGTEEEEDVENSANGAPGTSSEQDENLKRKKGTPKYIKDSFMAYAGGWMISASDESKTQGSEFDSNLYPPENIKKVDTILMKFRETEFSECVVPLSEVSPHLAVYKNDLRGNESHVKDLTIRRPVSKTASNPNDDELSLSFTSLIHEDPMRTNGERVTELAKTRDDSSPLDGSTVRDIIDGNGDRIELERNHYSEIGEGVTESKYHPVPIYTVEDRNDFTLAKLELIAKTTSLAIIRGADWGIDKELFKPRTVAAKNPNYEVITIRQFPQKNSNLWFTNKLSKQTANQWGTYDIKNKNKNKTSLKLLVDHLEECFDLAKDAYKEMCKNPEKFNEIMENLMKKLYNCRLEVARENPDGKFDKADQVPKECILLPFLTNIELSEGFEAQHEECKKFPSPFALNGKNDLLRYANEIVAGLNSAHQYIKAPLSRTTAHVENGCLGSMNMNLGPATCVWYSVTVEDSGKMTREMRHKGDTKTVKGIYNYGLWPCPTDVIDAGITVQKVIQKPSDIIYVGPGTYHWVQSEGYAVNISWNVMTTSFHQLSFAALMNDHYLANQFVSMIPLEHIVWNVAKCTTKCYKEGDEDFITLVKHMLYRSLGYNQKQLDFISRKNLELRFNKKPMTENADVHRCHECNQVLFNFVPRCRKMIERDNDKEGKKEMKDVAFCFRCVIKKKKKVQFVEQVYSIADLIKVYDSYGDIEKMVEKTQNEPEAMKL